MRVACCTQIICCIEPYLAASEEKQPRPLCNTPLVAVAQSHNSDLCTHTKTQQQFKGIRRQNAKARLNLDRILIHSDLGVISPCLSKLAVTIDQSH